MLRPGPLRVRIAAGPASEELIARARAEGLVLAEDCEEAELVACPEATGADLDGSAATDRERPAARDDPFRAAPSLAGEAAAGLSRRELEVLEFLADGWSNAEIASALRIGVRTVRFHLESVYGKLGVSRRGEAVREAARLGLVRFEF